MILIYQILAQGGHSMYGSLNNKKRRQELHYQEDCCKWMLYKGELKAWKRRKRKRHKQLQKGSLRKKLYVMWEGLFDPHPKRARHPGDPPR